MTRGGGVKGAERDKLARGQTAEEKDTVWSGWVRVTFALFVMGKGSPQWRLMMVTVGCLQNFLMGGVIFGWAAISNTLLLSNEGAPDLRASHIHEMFVMAS